MEEDIKTIQEKLKIIESLCTDDCINKSTVIQPLIYAIQNLIARYKELEEGKALTKKQEAMILKAIKQSAEEQITKEMKNFIPKSKVKEKIEELENQKSLYFEKQVIQGRIDLLQELLEE